MEIFKLLGRIGIDGDVEAQKALDRVSDKAKKVGETMKAVGKAVTLFGAGMVAGIIGVTNASSDLEEATSKFRTVFRGLEKEADAFADTLEKSYGLATVEARKYLGAVQDLLVPMGMERKEAALLSNEIVKLSVDLGSFNNLDTERVMLDIQSALVGNFETMKKYGVVLNATKVEQEIMNQGWAKSKDEITQNMKAQAAYNLMVAGSTDAMGDFIRTSDGYANQVKIMRSGLASLITDLGDIFIPIMKDFVKLINVGTGDIREWIKENKNLILILGGAGGVAAVLGPVLLLVGQLIVMMPQLTAGIIALKTAAFPLIAVFTGVAVAIGLLIGKIISMREEADKAAQSSRTLSEERLGLLKREREELLKVTEEERNLRSQGRIHAEEKSEELERLYQIGAAIRFLEDELEDKKQAKAQETGDKLVGIAAITAEKQKIINNAIAREQKRQRDERLAEEKRVSDLIANLDSGLSSIMVNNIGKIKDAWAAFGDFVIKEVLKELIKELGIATLAAKRLKIAISFLTGGIGSIFSSIIPGMAQGGSFVVPQGFPNDSFPIGLTSGEKVNVTPASVMRTAGASAGGGATVLNINMPIDNLSLSPENAEETARIFTESIRNSVPEFMDMTKAIRDKNTELEDDL